MLVLCIHSCGRCISIESFSGRLYTETIGNTSENFLGLPSRWHRRHSSPMSKFPIRSLAANCLGVSLAFLNWYLLRARARRTSSLASKRASYSSWVSSDAPLVPHLTLQPPYAASFPGHILDAPFVPHWTLQPLYAFFLYGHVPNVPLPFQLA
ncbi:unnamed protein product [Rhizophagus irregularis]|nr:unnamed protein product [Rhizophagus irregularis]